MNVTVHHAKTHLSQILKQIEKGEEIVICRASHPVARLVPFGTRQSQRPKVGTITSDPVKIEAGAFAPLDSQELKEWGLD